MIRKNKSLSLKQKRASRHLRGNKEYKEYVLSVSSSNKRRLMSIYLFLFIDAWFTLFLLVSSSTFLTYQWGINLDFNTFKSNYNYDMASVVWFSVLSGIILTTVLYRPLSHSIWFKPLWDKLEQEVTSKQCVDEREQENGKR